MIGMTAMLNEAITYFPPGVPDGRGNQAVGAPVNIKGRWQDKTVVFLDSNGEKAFSDAVVYTDREVAVMGKLARGHNAQPAAASIIRDVGISPALRGGGKVVKAML